MRAHDAARAAEIFKTPEFVTLSGVRYAINTDFKIWIAIEHLLLNRDGTEKDFKRRLGAALSLAYPKLPAKFEDAVDGILWFYSAGKAQKSRTSVKNHAQSGCRDAPLYDFDEDFEYIWGAFLSEYGIDLTECDLHWWKFRALMMSLGDECRFSKILAYRAMDTSKIENAELRRTCEKIKQRVRLPDRRTAEERERDTAECLAVLF